MLRRAMVSEIHRSLGSGFPLANISGCTQFDSCASCIDETGCVWCSSGTNAHSCLESSSSNDLCDSFEHSCGNENSYIIVFICVLSALVLLCCLTCFFRKSDNESFIERIPRQLSLPASARAFIFRNSALAEGEKEWICIICGFDNHPKYKSCTLCGRDQQFTKEYKDDKKRQKEIKKTKEKERKKAKNDNRMSSANSEEKSVKLKDLEESKHHIEALTSGTIPIFEDPMTALIYKKSFIISHNEDLPYNNSISGGNNSITINTEGATESNPPNNRTSDPESIRGWTQSLRSSITKILNPATKPEKKAATHRFGLSLREKSARRRKIWQRTLDDESGEFRWVTVDLSGVKIANARFGYTPGNSLFTSFDSSRVSEAGSLVKNSEVMNALIDVNSVDKSNEIKTGKSISNFNVKHGGGINKSEHNNSFDNKLSSSLSAYRDSDNDSTDSFGDSTALSSSPGFVTIFDSNSYLIWERLAYDNSCIKSGLQLANKNNEGAAQKFGAQTRKFLESNSYSGGQYYNPHVKDIILTPRTTNGSRDQRTSSVEMSPQNIQPFSNNEDNSNNFDSNSSNNNNSNNNDDIKVSLLDASHIIEVSILKNKSFYYDLESIASLPFKDKQIWFLDRMQDLQKPWAEGCVRLEIRRNHILPDSVGTFGIVESNDLHKWLRIQFAGEPGIDAGGLEREWFELTTQAFLAPSAGLFVCSSGEGFMGSYHINPISGKVNHHHLRYFRLIGRMIGKGIMEQQPLAVALSLPLRKQILGMPITFSDLEFVDAKLYESLLWLQNNDGVDDLCLDFTICYEYNGHRLDYDLKPNGANIPVTDENKEEYLELRLRHRLFDSIKSQLENLLIGIYEIVPPDIIAVFDYQELELLMCGVQELDVGDWRRHTEYLAEYQRLGDKHKVVKWFWIAMEKLSREEHIKLLQFVTGCSRLPAQGFKALQSSDGNYRKFNIQSIAKKDSLYPRAHTCFNKLDLPLYDSYEELERYLKFVINNVDVTGFTME